MMIRFTLRKYKYDYTKLSIVDNSEQAVIDIEIPETVENMLQDGYILERVGVVNDVSNQVSNAMAGRMY
jgi:hypothetical protein